ncbi:DMT family transporter [Rhodovibrionaceae bacterium A322]
MTNLKSYFDGSRLQGPQAERIATVLLLIAPAMFATNMLTAKATADFIPPVALAFWRWFATFCLLLPLVGGSLWRQRRQVWAEALDLLVLGGLGMGVCGAFVYIGADSTSATNIGLIYAAAPVLILLISSQFYGEALSLRQFLGVIVSLIGVVALVVKGDLDVLLSLSLTEGDIWIVVATLSWAIYSILLRYRPTALDPMTRFAAICLGGLVTLLPFTVLEGLSGDLPALDQRTLLAILLLSIVASFGAYQVYGMIQRVLGAGRTGLLLYLAPVYNSVLAWLILGESFYRYHLIGAILVLGGLLLASARGRK